MKILLSAIALLVGSNVAAIAAEQTLKFKLAYFFMEQKDGENHFMGVTIAPDGTLGTKDFFAKPGENGAFTGRSTYYFPKGTINVTMVGDGTGTDKGGHIKGKYQFVSGTGAYQGATVTGGFEGDYGDKSPLKNAALLDVELDIKTP